MVISYGDLTLKSWQRTAIVVRHECQPSQISYLYLISVQISGLTSELSRSLPLGGTSAWIVIVACSLPGPMLIPSHCVCKDRQAGGSEYHNSWL